MQSNKEVAQQWFSAAGRGDGDAFRATMTEDVVIQTMGTSVLSGTRDREEATQLIEALREYTQDGLEFTFVELTAEDDRVAAEVTGAGEMVDGQRYDNVYHMLFHFRDGKICRVKEYLDTALIDRVVGPLLASAG